MAWASSSCQCPFTTIWLRPEKSLNESINRAMKRKRPKSKQKKMIAEEKLTWVLRVVVEMGFIIFLFYSNLLMGEFTQTNGAQGKTLVFAIKDIFSVTNFIIAVISALVSHMILSISERSFKQLICRICYALDNV